ncbi:flagellar biosynthesis anti-sigma factor FlgM [Liquorilactobacillus mali]|uniref:Negative regulator of flagellin synthesis n=1 Tax=Liquorilactobacillus mali KCTC 3596 = DSM 20444 TaxID=1046596 RepID=J0L212_9LACO|nr:Negative regulator of flagellin synthesis [Liquorilactobacillus mali KCTC 3596 = DSM 20444]KRN11106.1 Negative regulator of flagellin synthesis [Liquorilactobacillus mali KCTC 3596 = DSM 20444]MDV7757487.1 flagellar biosynthesis anti-sigma factor FlgM [Liquorilactobacillus mali]QFQ75600.1 flagellar biosynthesis anti-sigma factor FlgM [Liquorilactobacillus mali]
MDILKIEGYQGTNIYGDQAAKLTKHTQLAASKNQTNNDSTEESTSVELSERAQKIMQGAQVEPEIDLKKVANLKNAINNGNYKISAEDIANRMMAQVDMQKED